MYSNCKLPNSNVVAGRPGGGLVINAVVVVVLSLDSAAVW